MKFVLHKFFKSVLLVLDTFSGALFNREPMAVAGQVVGCEKDVNYLQESIPSLMEVCDSHLLNHRSD